MNLFQAIGSRSKSSAINAEHLPIVNDFVDVAVGGKTDTVCVEDVALTTFETRRPSKAAVGDEALFNYNNKYGRFRFRAECRKIDGDHATFRLPTEITVIEKFGEKRKHFRLSKLITVQWRYAPDGVGNGPLVKGKVLDLSATGARLDVGREVRKGTLVEMTFEQIRSHGKALTVIGELMRPATKDGNGLITSGVRFKGLGLTSENAVSEFIQAHEKDDKHRHIAR